MIPKIAAMTPPPIPGPMYANIGDELKKMKEIIIYSFITITL